MAQYMKMHQFDFHRKMILEQTQLIGGKIIKLRKLEKKYNRYICILGDLQGPKFRVGKFTNVKEHLKKNLLLNEANKIDKKIKSLDIKITSKVGSGDKLFGSVNNSDLASAISKKGSELDKNLFLFLEEILKGLENIMLK